MYLYDYSNWSNIQTKIVYMNSMNDMIKVCDVNNLFGKLHIDCMYSNETFSDIIR